MKKFSEMLKEKPGDQLEENLNSIQKHILEKIKKLAKSKKEKDQDRALEMLLKYFKDPDDAEKALEKLG